MKKEKLIFPQAEASYLSPLQRESVDAEKVVAKKLIK